MGKSIEQVARDVLNQIPVTSINERHEYGGMIYQRAGRFLATSPRTQNNPTTVDVGQRNPNKGCPPNTTPIAYYHTHPTYSVSDFMDMPKPDQFELKGYSQCPDGKPWTPGSTYPAGLGWRNGE